MERTKIKRVLITGGAGFIGSHVVALFCNSGYDVRIIDDLSFGYRKFIDKRAEFIKGSIGNAPVIKKALRNVDAVIHLAASSIIKFSYEDPLGYYKNNVINALIMLEEMRKQKIKKIIFSSTAAVYGEPKMFPIPEDAPKNPITIYGSSKLAFEQALATYYHAFGLESVSLRYFNAYGPRDEQDPATRAVPIWIKSAIKGNPVPVFWNGKQLRDYVYVGDIARAHLAVLGISGCRYYNIGSGIGVLMRDIVSAIGKISGKKLEIEDRGERPGDPMKLVADITKIKKEVGWYPKTDLETGLRLAYHYYESVH